MNIQVSEDNVHKEIADELVKQSVDKISLVDRTPTVKTKSICKLKVEKNSNLKVN